MTFDVDNQQVAAVIQSLLAKRGLQHCVTCFITDAEAVLEGRTHSYSLKQFAQESARTTVGGRRIHNRILVQS